MRQFATISALNLLRLRLLDRRGRPRGQLSERLFVAVWPPDDVLDAIEALPRPDARRRAVDDPRAVARHAALPRRRRRRPRCARRSTVSAPPSSRRVSARAMQRLGRGVLCVPVSGPRRRSPRAVIDATRSLGQPPDHRELPRPPHAGARRRPSAEASQQRSTVDWTVATFALVRSHLGGGPARYETVATWPLQP